MKLLGWALAVLVVVALVRAHPALLFVVVPLVVAFGRNRVRLPAKAAGCAFAGSMVGGKLDGGHHTSAQIARHEAGHVAAARRVGLRVTEVKVGKGYGWVGVAKWDKDPVKNMAFLYGGQIAVHSQAGCSFDNAKIKHFRNQLPPDERAAADRKAKSIASSAVGMFSSVSSDAATIRATGTL